MTLPTDYYQVFGIEPKLALDLDDLQRQFYSLSRKYHPDRFARASASEQTFALEFTSLLNDAWRTFRDPVARAEYLLKRDGFDIGEQRSKDVPPELLEEVFELNMALEEARMGDNEAKETIREALTRFEEMLSELDSERDRLFTQYDTDASRETLLALRSLLNRRRYLQNLVRDAQTALA